ncbi:hypothetical protein R3P38DRAFT_2805190 [Favolaschia claudopus]|uniref:Uncharacterized protein n=1 Tax=Favolaschia claudopus TaxID=2862362 RepID=A0AAV9ZN55_9AGAR
MTSNQTGTEEEKEWKGLKLTLIKKEEEDGTNNYSKFKQKSILDLKVVGYWKYVDGEDYKPPVIPEIQPSKQASSLSEARKAISPLQLGPEYDDRQREPEKVKRQDIQCRHQRDAGVAYPDAPVAKRSASEAFVDVLAASAALLEDPTESLKMSTSPEVDYAAGSAHDSNGLGGELEESGSTLKRGGDIDDGESHFEEQAATDTEPSGTGQT